MLPPTTHTDSLVRYLCGLLLVLNILPSIAWSQEASDRAQQRGENVAQVVQGILGYARWPTPRDHLRLCVVAATQYADVLLASSAEGHQRPVRAHRLLLDDEKLESSCDAVYIGVLQTAERHRLLERLTGKPILSISESSEPCSDGSLFCLRVDDELASFEINLDSVARSGIRIHPQVLQLGNRTRSQP